MKKIMSVFLLGVLLLSIIPFGFAEEDSTEISDIELEEEIETMGSQEGAEYRLNQLELSLENQIEHAKDILAELNVSDEEMSELEEYVIELELLLERVQEIELEGTASDMAAEFVAVKKEAITLSQNFRKAIHSALTQEKIAEIRENAREMKELRKAEFKAQLEEKKENMYMKRISNHFKTMGIDADLEGLTREEAREMIREKVNLLSDEEKEEMKAAASQKRAEQKSNMQAKRAETRAKIEAKKTEMKANRNAKMEERKAQFSARIAEQKSNMQAKKVEFQLKMAERRGNTNL